MNRLELRDVLEKRLVACDAVLALWEADWGDRNSNNDNPAAYSDPTWTIAGAWNPGTQFATIPEPGTLAIIGACAAMLLRRRAARTTL